MWSRVWRLLLLWRLLRDKGNGRVLTFLGGIMVVVGLLLAALSITNYFRPPASGSPAAKRAERAALEQERQRAEQEERNHQFTVDLERRRQEELWGASSGGYSSGGIGILETGYSLLKDIGGEEPVYGLYSYAILVNDSDRSAKFLGNMFGDGFNSIPPIEETVARPNEHTVHTSKA
jgi:hypothetical protein